MKWRPRRIARRTWIAAACFVVLFAVVPLLLVASFPGLDEAAFTCRVKVRSYLDQTLEGQLEFLLVGGLEGRLPAERFVITVDHGYTRGVAPLPGPAGKGEQNSDPILAIDRMLWIQGTLMDEDTYYGEQYLFFGYPQLYVSQVKDGLLWPSQEERLSALYAAPIATLGSVYWVWVYPFAEEYTLSSWLLLMGRFLLVCVAIAIIGYGRKRDRRWAPGVTWALGVYALASIALSLAGL